MAGKVVITPTTCDTPDRIAGFLAVARQYCVGAPKLAVGDKPLRLQLVRIQNGSDIQYEIQVVE